MSTSDAELVMLIGKLQTIQAEVGGKPTDKKPKSGGAGQDRFMDIKSAMMQRLQTIRQMSNDAASAGRTAGDPKQAIQKQAEIRTNERLLQEECRDLENLLFAERKKKKSKYTPQELEVRQEIVSTLKAEIQNVTQMMRAGYVKPYTPTIRIDDIELGGGAGGGAFGGGGGGGGSAGGVENETKVTDEQQVQLTQIRERDQGFDELIATQIGQGIDVLHQTALAQNEEVKKQQFMLDELDKKIDVVHDHVSNVNSKMKDTLEQVGRSSDKFCMDVMCLIVFLGVCSILYNQLA